MLSDLAVRTDGSEEWFAGVGGEALWRQEMLLTNLPSFSEGKSFKWKLRKPAWGPFAFGTIGW